MGSNASAAVIVAVVLVVLGIGSRVQAFGAQRDWFPGWVGRKAAHVGFGAALLVSWALFPAAASSKWFAAVPPVMVALYFAAVALGWVSDPGTVKSGSRSGSPAGLLKGPVLYSAIFAVLTVAFWRTSPVAAAALGFMTLGDGMAEVVGRTVPSPRLPWSPQKSAAGSMAALVFGYAGGLAALWLLVGSGWLVGPWDVFVAPMAWVALVAAAVESLPFEEVDNVTATLAAVGVGYLVF